MGKLGKILSDEEQIDLTLSYSRVSKFDTEGPSALMDKTKKDSRALRTGSLIDDLLFDVGDFHEKYAVSQVEEPTATLATLCKIILDNYSEIPTREEVIDIIKRNNLWESVKKPELIIKKFDHDKFWLYLEEKYNIGNRVVVAPSDWDMAKEVVSIVKTHPHSADIFTDDMENHYQVEFKIKIKDFYFRGIIDIVSIHHKSKTIYFRDLKTGGGTATEFAHSFVKYRYYLQSAIYRLAFEQVCKDLDLEGYHLAPFEFLYIGLREKIPVVYRVSDKWDEASLHGFKIGSYTYRGLYELIEEIYFHWKNKVYDVPMDIYKRKGKVYLKDDFIV